jgi:hypothetical protein
MQQHLKTHAMFEKGGQRWPGQTQEQFHGRFGWCWRWRQEKSSTGGGKLRNQGDMSEWSCFFVWDVHLVHQAPRVKPGSAYTLSETSMFSSETALILSSKELLGTKTNSSFNSYGAGETASALWEASERERCCEL